MLIAFVTEAIGDSTALPVKVLLRTTCDRAVRSQSMPLILDAGGDHSAAAEDGSEPLWSPFSGSVMKRFSGHQSWRSPRYAVALPRSRVRPPHLFRHPFARKLVEQIVTRHGIGEKAVERLQDGRLKRDRASAGEAHIAMLRGLFQ
jgi:hypothetical protein